MEYERAVIKFAIAGLALAAISATMAACGGTRSPNSAPAGAASSVPESAATTPTHAPATAHEFLNDGDNDTYGDADNDNNHDNDHDNFEDHKPNENGKYHDGDDEGIVDFGHPASASLKRTLAALVKRYYALALAGDGQHACAMLIPGLARAVPEDYGHRSAGPAYLRAATSCPAVLTLLFKHVHAQLDARSVITGVRVSEDYAQVLLGSRTAPASSIALQREDGVWWVDEISASPLS